VRVETHVLEPFASNLYVVKEEASREALIVDPGRFLPSLVQNLVESRFRVKALVATHGHFDHVLEAGEYTTFFRQGLWLHPNDWPLVENMRAQLKFFGMEDLEPVVYPNLIALSENHKFRLGEAEFLVLHTPGHSPGSVVLWSPKEKIAFTGDLLFRESIGRTDLPGSNPATMRASLEVLFSILPEETRIFPGHGPETTVAHEKQRNPFLKDLLILGGS